VREIVAELPDGNGHNGGGLKMEQFTAVREASGGLIARALQGDLAVPDFSRLEREARPARVGSYGRLPLSSVTSPNTATHNRRTLVYGVTPSSDIYVMSGFVVQEAPKSWASSYS
jgi:hypothetical protein